MSAAPIVPSAYVVPSNVLPLSDFERASVELFRRWQAQWRLPLLQAA